MSRMTKVIGFSVPPEIFCVIQSLADSEGKSKSELFREMIRVYLLFRDRRLRDETHWIDEIIEQAREEKRQKGFILNEEQKELKRLQRYGALKAKQLGIKSDKDIERMMHEAKGIDENCV
jgi:metal-responsive CopG/Arc/MetJ family transcriptional regulator